MGYRSCVAILMYGEKQDCEMVLNLFLCSGEIAQEDKDFFERNKQESNAGSQHFVFWSFDNVKWYDQADTAKNKLFNFVTQIEDVKDIGDPADRNSLAIEFVRFGEDDNDNEREATERSDFLLDITRSIRHPDFFKWCPSP